MEPQQIPLNQKLEGLPGGEQLWKQVAGPNVTLKKVKQTIVRVNSLPNPNEGQSSTVSQDYSVGTDLSGKPFAILDTDWMQQLPGE